MKENQSAEWYKNAIVYGLDIETFYDADGDGVGDFKGATAKLPYLAELGITCIWLLPFYPTSNRDNGYDVISYTNVDQRLGTLNDFRSFVDEAKKYDIRILIDLVIHHTSNEHPWFIAASTDRNSQYFGYYVWSKQLPPQPHDKNIFPTVEQDVWSYDEYAKRYYHHKFYHFEPDLNIANPQVQKEIYRILDFWLSFNIDGFRIDAATHLFSKKGLAGTEIKNPGTFIENMRQFIEKKKPEAIILGEADVEVDKVSEYLKNGNRFHLLFNFLLNNSLFLALASEKKDALHKRLVQLAKISPQYHWLNFVRNLDELDLERLSDQERKVVYKKFAPDPTMRVYGRGIRRRIAPMVQGNKKRLKMIYSLLFALPGSPMFMYGDEIGMGDDLTLPERVAVRTPMQWSHDTNAGFSTASPKKIIRAVIDTTEFSYKKINVDDQLHNKDSLLSFIKTVIQIRKHYPLQSEIYCKVIETDSDAVLGLLYEDEYCSLLIFHNLSPQETSVVTDIVQKRTFREILSDSTYEPQSGKKMLLSDFGYRWFVQNKIGK